VNGKKPPVLTSERSSFSVVRKILFLGRWVVLFTRLGIEEKKEDVPVKDGGENLWLRGESRLLPISTSKRWTSSGERKLIWERREKGSLYVDYGKRKMANFGEGQSDPTEDPKSRKTLRGAGNAFESCKKRKTTLKDRGHGKGLLGPGICQPTEEKLLFNPRKTRKKKKERIGYGARRFPLYWASRKGARERASTSTRGGGRLEGAKTKGTLCETSSTKLTGRGSRDLMVKIGDRRTVKRLEKTEGKKKSPPRKEKGRETTSRCPAHTQTSVGDT